MIFDATCTEAEYEVLKLVLAAAPSFFGCDV